MVDYTCFLFGRFETFNITLRILSVKLIRAYFCLSCRNETLNVYVVWMEILYFGKI